MQSSYRASSVGEDKILSSEHRLSHSGAATIDEALVGLDARPEVEEHVGACFFHQKEVIGDP